MASGTTIGEKHWVYEELRLFKQKIIPVIAQDATLLNDEEKNIITTKVFNEEVLDQPIKSINWGILLKAVIKLPEKDQENLIQMYVEGLSTGDEILREDAVGGMLKLLTINYDDGNSDAETLKLADGLKDLQDISEMQEILVKTAYAKGLVDSNTKDYFRPKDKLTTAEAISILYQVIIKYDIDFSDALDEQDEQDDGLGNQNIENNWLDKELKSFENISDKKIALLQKAYIILNYGSDKNSIHEPIDIKLWAELLSTVLEIKDEDVVKSYTFGLVSDSNVSRDIAIAGMVKLLHYSHKVEGRDASDQERLDIKAAFIDCADVFDESKLAIAYSEGLIRGYKDQEFKPKKILSKGEALVLMARIIDQY